MTVHIVADFGGPTETPPDIGDHEVLLLDDLVTGLVSDAPTDDNLGGRPPSFPWGGHSNGVSQRP